MTVTLRPARFPVDAETVAALVRDFVLTVVEQVPEDREGILAKYPLDAMDAMTARFAEIHARPHGQILLAFAGDRPVGVGMMRRLPDGAAELQRIYVRPEARGAGLGRRLTLALMEQARADGAPVVRLDTGRTLAGAIALYRGLGFVEIPPYHRNTPQLDHALVYFERPL